MALLRLQTKGVGYVDWDISWGKNSMLAMDEFDDLMVVERGPRLV